MNKKKNFSSIRDRKLFPVLVFMLVIFVLGGLQLLRNSSGLFWTEWYPLLIPESEINDSLLSRLKTEFDGNLLFEGNTQYEYNGFNGMLSITPEQLEGGKKLLPDDPRLDPFISGCSKYFKQDIYSIFYLPVIGSPLQYRYALRDVWKSSWIFPDARQDYPVIVLAVMLSVLLLIQSGRLFFPVLLLLIYIGSAHYLGEHNILLPGVISLFLLSRSGRPGNFRAFFSVLVPFPMVFAGIFNVVNPVDCAAVLVIFLSGFFMDISPLKIQPRRDVLRKRGKDHELFVPVSLVSSPRCKAESDWRTGAVRLVPAFGQAVLLLLIFTLTWTENRQLPVSVPRAVAAGGADWSWDGIRYLELSRDIPGVAEMLMHRAYQESLPYGGTWSLPVEGESLTLTVYSKEEGVVRPSLKVVQTYDQEWLTDFFNRMSREGPGILFRSEAGIPALEMAIETPGAPSMEGLTALAVFIILGIVLSLMSAAGLPYGSSEDYRMRNHLLMLRRKQQAA